MPKGKTSLKKSQKMRKDKIKKILFITPSNIGDVFLTLPAIWVLKKEFPKASITVLSGPLAAEVFEAKYFVTGVMVYDKREAFLKKIKLIIKLRRQRFDLAVDLRHSFFPILVGARKMTPVFKTPFSGKRHMRDAHLSRLSSLGMPVKGAEFPIIFDNADIGRVNNIIGQSPLFFENKIVAVAPGAKSLIKRWNIKGFKEFCDYMSRYQGILTCVIGSRDDKQIAQEIISGLKQKAYDFTGLFNLREVSYFLSLCSLLVTNDSAPLHIAGAVNTPVIAIFGPTDDRKYGPVSENSFVIRRPIPCAPCQKPVCPNDLECLKLLDSRHVINKAKEILGLGAGHEI
jgi:heptosyltransferase II